MHERLVGVIGHEAMIRGLHGLFYSSDADATRAFMRDALKLPFSDVGGGWLIFDLPEADVGVHPIGGHGEGDAGPPANTHDVSFYCDDIEGTVADLRSRGVSFKDEPADHGYGYVAYFTMPGGIEVQLYEPKYTKASQKAAKAPGKKAARKPGVKAGKSVSKTGTKPVKATKKPVVKVASKAAKKPATRAGKSASKPAAKPAAKKRR